MRVPENFAYYLSAHRDCSDRLLAGASEMTAEYIELSSDPKALLIRRMVYSVPAEMHRMKGFVRLSDLGDKILYGYLKPRHEIGDRICDHFAMRSPGTMVVLGYHSKSWISLFFNGSMQKSAGPGLDATLYALRAIIGSSGCDGEIERVWEAYYSSQYCPERRNIQAFRRRMPKSSLASARDSLERNENGATLNDFGMIFDAKIKRACHYSTSSWGR